MKKPAVLITGAGGLLGSALCRAAVRDWTVFGIYRRHPPNLPRERRLQLDLTDTNSVARCIRTLKPAAVIHAAAASRVAECQAQPLETEKINVMVPALLAEVCAESRADLAFVSTDLVFDGNRPPYSEDHIPSPRSVYGDQKTRAETAVLEKNPAALVCRLPLLIGLAPDPAGNFTLQMLQAIASGQPVTLFSDEYRTPVDAGSAARGILQLLGRRSGLLHLGGRTRISRHALGMMAADCMGIDPTMIRAAHIAELPGAELRAPDCSLDSRCAFALGFDPGHLNAALRKTIAAMRRSHLIQFGDKFLTH